MRDIKYKGFVLCPILEYKVWKQGYMVFSGSLKTCKKFLDENPNGFYDKDLIIKKGKLIGLESSPQKQEKE